MNDNILSQFLDQRVEITGVFENFSLVDKRDGRKVQTALFQDVSAHIDGTEHNLGHRWIQNADDLKRLELSPGDRLKCVCRVRQYKKYLDIPNPEGFTSEFRYSLSYPIEIQILHRIERQSEPLVPTPKSLVPVSEPFLQQEVPSPTISPAALIVEVRRVAKLVGGMESLQELVEALKDSN